MPNEFILDIVSQVLQGHPQTQHYSHTFFDEDQVQKLVRITKTIFLSESTVLRIQGPTILVGDIHGNLDSLLHIFQTFGYPPTTTYLFLGDYVDRGKHSIEVIVLLYCLKILYREKIFLLRGNHETRRTTKNSDFHQDCLIQLSKQIYNSIIHSFDAMPLAAIVNEYLAVHGGISPSIETISELEAIARPISDHDQPIIEDILWSDPKNSVFTFEDSNRGFGYLFGEQPLHDFLQTNNLKGLIRGHEFCKNGFSYPFGKNGHCLTIFSSADYCSKLNESAIVSLTETSLNIIPLPKINVLKRIILPEWLIAFEVTKPNLKDTEPELLLPQEIYS